MNGYSKISSTSHAHKSRSIDFSDFFSFPQTPKPNRNTTTGPNVNQEAKKLPDDDEPVNDQQQVKKRTANDETSDQNGERFGVILGRSSSVSSASTGIQATMKRAFSIRRSSSVSERYCRIHDHGYIALSSPIGGDHDIDDIDGDVIGTTRSVKMKKNKLRGGKILKACKRILGF